MTVRELRDIINNFPEEDLDKEIGICVDDLGKQVTYSTVWRFLFKSKIDKNTKDLLFSALYLK